MSSTVWGVVSRLIVLAAISVASGVAGPVSAQTGTCTAAIASEFLDVANVRARIVNTGNLFYRGEPHVYEVPKGQGMRALFTAGLWFGGFLDDDLRVAAARYGPYEFWAGPLDESGNPPPDCSDFDRIWKVNQSDIDNYDVGGSAAVNLAEWPTGLGAPTLTPAEDDGIDNDRDGSTDEPGEMRSITEEVLTLPLSQRIERVIDLEAGERPDMLGDQMLWWIMNDRGNMHTSSGSTPIGLEVHGQAFAINLPGHIANATFYRYAVFYRGNAPLTDTYFGVFVDPDLGDFQDDFVGSDSAGQFGFVYNADNDDGSAQGYGLNPPAVAVGMLQTPIVPSAGDTAMVSGLRIPDYRNVGMTSFVSYGDGGAANGTPSAAPDYHHFISGRWKTGIPIRVGGDGYNVDPSEPVTKFMYQGDPVTAEFWSERNTDGVGSASLPSDRRFVQSSGPVTLNPGDRQELAFGIAWARGTDFLNSVEVMRDAIAMVGGVYASLFPVINVGVEGAGGAPGTIELGLHPNPAVESVQITFRNPEQDHVRVDVIDALGRRVAILLDGETGAETRTLSYDVAGLPAGVYFVRLITGSTSRVASLVVAR